MNADVQILLLFLLLLSALSRFAEGGAFYLSECSFATIIFAISCRGYLCAITIYIPLAVVALLLLFLFKLLFLVKLSGMSLGLVTISQIYRLMIYFIRLFFNGTVMLDVQKINSSAWYLKYFVEMQWTSG